MMMMPPDTVWLPEQLDLERVPVRGAAAGGAAEPHGDSGDDH